MTEQQWTQIYRSPEGAGFEKRSPFRSIALELGGDLVCACSPSGTVRRERYPLELQFLWSEGKMPAVGAKVTREPGPVKFGTTVIAFVEDPDGYKIELVQRD